MRGGGGARWFEPEDYHITLKFIGDVDEGAARDIDGDIRRPKALVRLEGLSWPQLLRRFERTPQQSMLDASQSGGSGEQLR